MTEVRVLHAIARYLSVSENWLYPQLTRVPDVAAAVLCNQQSSLDLFPPAEMPVFLDPPPWAVGMAMPRLAYAITTRLGYSTAALTARRVGRWRPQLIHAHFGPMGWRSLPLRASLNVPLVTSFYGVDAFRFARNPMWRGRFSELFHETARVIIEGPTMRDRLVGLGCPAAKIRAIPVGVDMAKVRWRRRDFGVPLRVVMMARFVEKKGLPDGLRACALARRAGLDLRVRIVGDAAPGQTAGLAIARELRDLAASAALCGAVTFEGLLPPAGASEVLQQSDVLLCPSKHSTDGDAEGGSSVALLEAMAAGLLCIGTRHCDIPDVVVDGKTGCLCESGDIEGIAASILRVAGEPDAARAMTVDGRAHVATHYSLERELAALGATYREILAHDSSSDLGVQ